ncbi:substrate-binding domain-containing protein [Streptomyces jeddahensis]|uniref:substrate-binding domain-containing protein n=1 Tax=Streptomyces jeddahensis TaxID=1716141 RepID=UPI001E60D407|nr:substrate-binding domain-containing protein [Streptomyces jeddahensis]
MKAYRCGAAALAAVCLAAGLAACGEAGESGASRRGGPTIGLLLPDIQVSRYETFDRPLIEKKVKELCPECTVKYANAKGDVAAQHQQVDSMITSGVRVLLIDVVDAASLRSSIVKARDAGIPVVAYDRIADGPVSAIVAYDLVEAGKEQSEALLRALGDKARSAQIVMLDTPPVIQETVLRTKGSLSALQGKVRAVRTYTVGALGAERAYSGMSDAIADLGADNIDGVVASNDLMASGAISALKAAHISPLPPVTGMDTELTAVQRIVQGEQYMTVYKPYKPEADAAAEIAVLLARGRRINHIAKDQINSPTTQGIPAVVLTPIPVTVDNIKDAVVKDGTYTIDQICTPKFASACEKAGLTY